MLETVKEIRAMMPRIGVRKLQYMLAKNYGLEIGRDRLFACSGHVCFFWDQW